MLLDRDHLKRYGRVTPVRVLIVEPDDSLANAMRRPLEARGFAVQMADSYKRALKKATEWLPDVVVSDLHLPDKSGLELIQRLRWAHPKLPMIAVIDSASQNEIVRVREAGFVTYLPKPFNAEQLDVLVHRLLVDEHINDALDESRAAVRKPTT